MRKFRFGGDLLSIPSVKSESGVVQSSLKQRTWLLSAQGSVPPSKVQRGRVGIPGDFGVPAVRAVEITELVYELAPKNLVHEWFTVSESPYPPKGPPFDTKESWVE